eukprot:scaffold35472_cov31-Tisochrysis_lutea.AAC.7
MHMIAVSAHTTRKKTSIWRCTCQGVDVSVSRDGTKAGYDNGGERMPLLMMNTMEHLMQG